MLHAARRLPGMTGRLQLPKKLDMLWSFIKSHLKSKCVVFLSSCKQVDSITMRSKRAIPAHHHLSPRRSSSFLKPFPACGRGLSSWLSTARSNK